MRLVVLPGAAMCLSPSQAGSSAVGVLVTFRDAWHNSRKGVSLRPRPRPGWEGGPPFQLRNSGSRAGAASRTPPIRGSGPLIGWIRGDVVRFTDSTPSAGRAGGIVLLPRLCSFVCSPGPRCVLAVQPGAGASSRRRRRHGVPGHCGECASARAAAGAPPGPGTR